MTTISDGNMARKYDVDISGKSCGLTADGGLAEQSPTYVPSISTTGDIQTVGSQSEWASVETDDADVRMRLLQCKAALARLYEQEAQLLKTPIRAHGERLNMKHRDDGAIRRNAIHETPMYYESLPSSSQYSPLPPLQNSTSVPWRDSDGDGDQHVRSAVITENVRQKVAQRLQSDESDDAGRYTQTRDDDNDMSAGAARNNADRQQIMCDVHSRRFERDGSRDSRRRVYRPHSDVHERQRSQLNEALKYRTGDVDESERRTRSSDRAAYERGADKRRSGD